MTMVQLDPAAVSILHQSKQMESSSPTCVLNFEEATGFMIGPENKGLSSMFTMMNWRIVVGIQGLGISETAYQML